MIMKDKKPSDQGGKLLNEIISLGNASQFSGLSSDHLRRLVENGAIWGVKIGRNWVTTREAVEEYKNQKHPRGPNPKRLNNKLYRV